MSVSSVMHLKCVFCRANVMCLDFVLCSADFYTWKLRTGLSFALRVYTLHIKGWMSCTYVMNMAYVLYLEFVL